MTKRLFDIISSLLVLMTLLPFFLVISILIMIDSSGGVFYIQQRVGRGNVDFGLYKFRTMVTNADKSGQLTVGAKDSRITKVGYFLRKFKIDEFPQLINVLKGEMSIIGPRPEVRKYVELYSEKQMKVLEVLPGLSDYASIEYLDENELLGNSGNPEKTYIDEIMPAKLNLNIKYINEIGLKTDIKIIFKTIFKIIS